MWTRNLGRAAPALALLVLVLVAVGARAERSAPGAAPHLFSVPSDGPAAVALARTQARVVARYAAFTLVVAEGDDATRLRRAGADQRDDMREVRLGGQVLDPLRERAPLAAKRRAPQAPGLAVVQFVGPIKDAWLDRLRSTGVRVVTYMAENGYLVSGSAERAGGRRGSGRRRRRGSRGGAVHRSRQAWRRGQERGSPAARSAVALGRRRLACARPRGRAGPEASRDVSGRAVPDPVRRARCS